MLFLCLHDLVSKGTPQGYYAKLRRLGGEDMLISSEKTLAILSLLIQICMLIIALLDLLYK